MPITLDDLKSRIDPLHTVLLLGAGASIPSGAPSGADLAKRLWKEVANSEPQSDDLIETASILVRRYTRLAMHHRDPLSSDRPGEYPAARVPVRTSPRSYTCSGDYRAG